MIQTLTNTPEQEKQNQAVLEQMKAAKAALAANSIGGMTGGWPYNWQFPPAIQPCPTCGHCPTCGRSKPYYNMTVTASGGNTYANLAKSC